MTDEMPAWVGQKKPFKSKKEAIAAWNDVQAAFFEHKQSQLELCRHAAKIQRSGPQAQELIDELCDAAGIDARGFDNYIHIGSVADRLGVADLDLAPADVQTVLILAMNQVEELQIDDDE